MLLLFSGSEEEGAVCSQLQRALPELHAAPRLTFSILALSQCTLQLLELLLSVTPPPALKPKETHRAGSRFPRPLGSRLCPHEVTRPSPGDGMLSGSRGLWDMGETEELWLGSITHTQQFQGTAPAFEGGTCCARAPHNAQRGRERTRAARGLCWARGQPQGGLLVCNGEAEGVMLQGSHCKRHLGCEGMLKPWLHVEQVSPSRAVPTAAP